MSVRRSSAVAALAVLMSLCCSACPSVQAQKKKAAPPATAAEKPVPSYYGPQPATEDIDLNMYARIRDEGLNHSHVMEFASALMDGIGPRLTGSPNWPESQRVDPRHPDQTSASKTRTSKTGASSAWAGSRSTPGPAWSRPTPSRAHRCRPRPGRPPPTAPSPARPSTSHRTTKRTSTNTRASSPAKSSSFGAMRDVPPVDKPLFDALHRQGSRRDRAIPMSSRRRVAATAPT